jgi:uncharacterized membrane protein YphA (DoxX/SURF4 family)
MLADHERRALEEIEAGLTSADPTFAERLGGPITQWRLVLVLTTVTGVCAVAVGLFAGRAGLVVLGLLTLAALIATYTSWRDRARG